MLSRKLLLVVFSLLFSPAAFAQSQDDLIQVIVAPESGIISKDLAIEVVSDALRASDPAYDIHDEVTDTLFLTTIQSRDLVELQHNPNIVVQRNQHRQSFTSTSVLSLLGADLAQTSPHNATGSGYATVVIDTGVRATHGFFTLSGTEYDEISNPSRVTIEHCQSAGFPITDGLGNFILDGSGNKLYEGISQCNGNAFVPTVLSGFTYYSNSVPGTTTPSFGASAPCAGVYPGFSSGCRHGSHVSGIAAGTAAMYSGTAYAGIAPASNIISFNVFTQYTDTGICGGGSPCLSATDADILSALSQVEELAVSGEKIGSINMSLGGGSYSDESTCTQDNILYYYAFARLKALGIPVVIATGNNGYRDKISAPACVSNAYSVGATTISSPGVDEIASYSNITAATDYLAPGTSIVSATSDDETSFFSASGTSMATPIVSGAFTALRALFDGAHAPYPYRSLDSIADALSTTGVLLSDMRSSGVVQDIPRINIAAAINSLSSKPYITLPNQSTVNISYPFDYTFSVSGENPIDANDITVAAGTTVGVGVLSCTQLTASSYDCTLPITSQGNLLLTVVDSLGNTYTTPAQIFETVPVIESVSTTTVSGTYSVGTIIPVTASVVGVDSSIRIGSHVSALLNNGVSVVLTAANSSSNNLAGSYTVGALGSGEDISQLKVDSFSDVILTENDGTIYTNAYFDANTTGFNMDQSGKAISIDTIAPLITIAALTQPASGTSVMPGGTIVLTLISNKSTSAHSISINGTTPISITQVTPTTIQATQTVSTGDLGGVTFSATVIDQFGNTSPAVTATTDGSALTMVAASSSGSSGGGGGGGSVSTPTVLSAKDKESFCSMALLGVVTEGSASSHVLYIETALQVAGYFGSMPNSDYNSGTTLAVKNFQSRYSPANVTGNVDTQTWELLKFYGGCGTDNNKREISGLISNTKKGASDSPVLSLKQVQKVGSRSPEVKLAKSILKQLGLLPLQTKPTPFFTSQMRTALKKFQRKQNFPVTGTLNNRTYRALLTQ